VKKAVSFAKGCLGGLADRSRRVRGDGKSFADASQMNRKLLEWLNTNPAGRPFFAFVNYFDAHHPYVLPEGAEHRFGRKPETRSDYLTLHRWWSLDKRKLPARDLEMAVDAYDDCLAYLDGQLGRLFDDLESRGVLENTLVIVTADHGEHFGEHQLFCHGASLYAPEVHVPLLVAGPSRVPEGESVAAPVSLRDLPATVVDLLGLGDGAPFPGTSLARMWGPSGGSDSAPDAVLSEIDAPPRYNANQDRSPVCLGAMKAVVDREEKVYIRGGDGREELYDLRADPLQVRDLSGSPDSGPDLERLRSALKALLAD
jgi:arylsulfatase A-like enzyme